MESWDQMTEEEKQYCYRALGLGIDDETVDLLVEVQQRGILDYLKAELGKRISS